MEILLGKNLVSGSAHVVSAQEALADTQVVAFYFSAHWSPPCRNFSPILRRCYNEVRKTSDAVQIVFVSKDRTESDMYEYMHEAHGDWLALPFADPANKLLVSKYNVTEIPRLVVVNAVSGDTINPDARTNVETSGAEYFAECVQQASLFAAKQLSTSFAHRP